MNAFLEKMGGSCMERVIKIGNRLFKIQCIGKPIRSRHIRGVGVRWDLNGANLRWGGLAVKTKYIKPPTIQYANVIRPK